MNYINTYLEIGISSEVMGSSHAQHIKLLFEKIIKDIDISIEAINNKNKPLKCKKISNANNIINYFLGCLDFKADENIAKRLEGIYLHLQKLLFWANAHDDLQKLVEAKAICTNLNTWWNHATV